VLDLRWIRDRDFNLCIGSFGPIPIEIVPRKSFIVSNSFFPCSSGSSTEAGAAKSSRGSCGGEAWFEDEVAEQNPVRQAQGQRGGVVANSMQRHEGLLQANPSCWAARLSQATLITPFHGDGRGKSSNAANMGADLRLGRKFS
jgi:hypothetical protein